MNDDVDILDTRFRTTTDEPGLLAYTHAFVDAYAAGARRTPPTRRWELAVSRGRLDIPTGGRPVPVHRSKHAYWSFDGLLAAEGPRRVVWPGRGIAVTVRTDAGRADVTVDPSAGAAAAGEAVFHVARGLALYLRDATRGALVHASAVAVGGRAVLFTGQVLAGKSTLLTEAVLRYGAQPLANDRVWLCPGDPPLAVSWPSYASYCEGTLLNYEPLAAAAARYESPSCPYRTQSWPGPLRQTFAKDAKRVYPMTWFTEAAGADYLPEAPVAALVLARVSPDQRPGSPRPLDLAHGPDRDRVTGELAAQLFDAGEPSFLPWHGLAPPTGAPTADQLVDRLAAAGVHAYELTTHPSDLSALKELLWNVQTSART